MSSYARVNSHVKIVDYRHTWIDSEAKPKTSIDLDGIDMVLDDPALARALAARFTEAANDLDRAIAEHAAGRLLIGHSLQELDDARLTDSAVSQ